MKINGIITLIYGLLVLAGGVMGFMKAQSLPSLISGVAFGTLLIFSAFTMYKGYSWGFTLAFSTTAFLTLFFMYRFSRTYSFMPSGLMVILSALVMTIFFWNKCFVRTCSNENQKKNDSQQSIPG